MFHRLTPPTYPFSGAGTVPAGYDYLNTPSDASVGRPGAPANADGRKSSGANDGSYFVCFGEDGSSNHANRGLKALGENTDILDDIVQGSIARLMVDPLGFVADGTVSTILLGSNIFVGTQGTPNTQEWRDQVVRIVDADFNELEIGGVRVAVTLIHDGASNNVLGTQVSGFRSGSTYVNISPSLPNGTVYRALYSVRSSFAAVSQGTKGSLSDAVMASYSHVSWVVRKLLRELHAPPAANQTWNGTWDSDIRALASAGLNERYRRATTVPSGFTNAQYNSPGAGSQITRDGQALTMYLPFPGASLDSEAYVYPDPILASFRVKHAGGPTTVWPSLSIGGGVGLTQEIGFSNTTDSTVEGASFLGMAGPLVLELLSRNIPNTSIGGGSAMTRIARTGVGTANPDSGATTDARRMVQVAPGDFAHNGSVTSLRARLDFIEVTDNATNTVIGTYLVDSLASSTRILLTSITGGAPPNFGASAKAVKLRLLQVTAALGGNTRYQEGQTGFAGLVVTQPPTLLTNITLERALAPAAIFLASFTGRELTGNYLAAKRVVAWGGFTNALPRAQTLKGYLHGDGGVESLGGRISGNLITHRQASSHPDHSSNASLAIDPTADSHYIVRLNGASSSVQLTVSLTGTYIPVYGDKILLKLELAPASDNLLTVVWPAVFKFADGDGVIPAFNSGTRAIYVCYEFEYTFTTYDGDVWLASRRDYY